jgi:hypothetical protein
MAGAEATKVSIRDPEWATVGSLIESEHRRGALTLVIGSGISQFEPSSVPVAGKASSELARRLRDLFPNVRDRLARGTEGVPFEVLMGRLREMHPDWEEFAIARLATISAPNPIHDQIAAVIAKAATSGTLCHIITSNYDLGIELALNRIGPLNRPGNRGDSRNWNQAAVASSSWR